MKVLIIEDDAANITSAKNVVGDAFGNDTECTVIRTVRELCRIEVKDFDLVLSDGWIPAGIYDGLGPDNIPSNQMVFIGSTVALAAQISDVPCVLCTDSNGHHDLQGCLLERGVSVRTFGWRVNEEKQDLVVRESKLKVATRPEKTSAGSKRWIGKKDLQLLFDGEPRPNKNWYDQQ